MPDFPLAPDPADIIQGVSAAEDCLDLPHAREILARCRKRGLPVRVIGAREVPDIPGTYPANLAAGKRHLLLCRNRGAFLKPCPGTKAYRCCGYQVLNIGMNCPMDCVYCILQSYLNNPWLSFFVNTEDLWAELDAALTAARRDEPERLFRIGTGEFTDSLVLDNLTGFSKLLVPFMARHDNAILELKTKSANIQNLEGLDHGGRCVAAWSLNSETIMRREEQRAAPLAARLEAARRCAAWGYRLAFHFDPIVIHEGWEAGYRNTIRALFDAVPKEAIAWISLGALRYLPDLKGIAGGRFPASRIFHHASVEGLDGKRRYFRPERTALYRVLADEIAGSMDDRACLYFCMENDAVWREVLGFAPEERGGLPAMLDAAARGLPQPGRGR